MTIYDMEVVNECAGRFQRGDVLVIAPNSPDIRGSRYIVGKSHARSIDNVEALMIISTNLSMHEAPDPFKHLFTMVVYANEPETSFNVTGYQLGSCERLAFAPSSVINSYYYPPGIDYKLIDNQRNSTLQVLFHQAYDLDIFIKKMRA